ncbi:hypothetical protein ACSSS7_002191 [Eimeria intestinalis]
MAAAVLESALQPWGLGLTPEGVGAFEHAGAVSPAAAKEFVLNSDLRRLHLAPHAADPTNFSALLSKSMQAPPVVAACAAASDQPLTSANSPASDYCLKNPLLCMILSFQDVRLPTKDVEEDFSGGAQGIKGNRKRLLSLKLTDGRGASFVGIELRFCPQLDAVPLLPGVKLLLLPGLVLYRGMALLSPQGLQSLGGGAAQLREAYTLKADIEERRKLIQHILKENAQLQQRIKEDKADTGPPKFVPFSFCAQVPSVPKPKTPAKETAASQKGDGPSLRESLKREVETGTSPGGEKGAPKANSAARSVLIAAEVADLKHERLRQLEKATIVNTVGAERLTLESRPRGARGGRSRRERREREEDLAEYLRPSGRPVTYSLFDLIKADAEQTNSTAATSLLCASEAYVLESSALEPAAQINPPVASPMHADYSRRPPRGRAPRAPRSAGDAARGPSEDGSSFRPEGRRGAGRGRGRGRVRVPR